MFDLETGEFLRQIHPPRPGTRERLGPRPGLVAVWIQLGVRTTPGDDEMLEVAERNADYWLAHLPDDGVPYWDFDADLNRPLPWGPQKDSSAGAIAASGLLDLAKQTKSPERAAAYRDTALAMLDALAGTDYLADQTPGWEGVLRHGVYHTEKNLGVDESRDVGRVFLFRRFG